MDILPIQVSSVPCERVFSSAKETITPRRNRMGPDTMEACQVHKFSLHAHDGLDLDFTSHFAPMSVLEEMELLGQLEEQVPENLPDYRDVMEHHDGAQVNEDIDS